MGSIDISQITAGSINLPIANFSALPSSKTTNIDPLSIAKEWTTSFNTALESKDHNKLSNLFLEESYWRDHLASSWDFHTFHGPSKILEFFTNHKDGCRIRSVDIDESTPFRAPHINPAFDAVGNISGVESFLKIETDVGNGMGVVRLVEEKGEWKVFTLYTAMRELRGHEESVGGRRPLGVDHGGKVGRKNWRERRVASENCEDGDPIVLILGAGQGGLTSAARLKMLGVDALIVDRSPNVGDSWRNRYHQLVLHDPVWYDHLPYMNFPSHWPIFTPKDKLADFFDSYAKLLELNVWTSTKVKKATWSDADSQWTVELEIEKEPGIVEIRILRPKHIVQATGHSGEKSMPNIKGMETFIGSGGLVHSSEFKGASSNSEGKNAIVIGSCNSGHDISQDFFEKGYSVTMIQRSTTCVISSAALLSLGLAGLYDETSPPVEDADVFVQSIPSAVAKGWNVKATEKMNDFDKKTLEGLRKVGFKLDQGPDDAGLTMKYFQRGGGYYIDVGASQLIIDGKIAIKSGSEIESISSDSIKLTDGTVLPADEIVFATGYQNMRTQAGNIFGDELYERVKDVWGFNEEGEIRTMWRRTGHPGFWFMGGNLALCRYFSRCLALQIKGLEIGLYKYEEDP